MLVLPYPHDHAVEGPGAVRAGYRQDDCLRKIASTLEFVSGAVRLPYHRAGATAAGRPWMISTPVMLAAHARFGSDEEHLAVPDDSLSSRRICALSGQSAHSWCPSVRREWLPAHDAEVPCSWHHESNGVVTIACQSATWAQELDLLQPELLGRLNEALSEAAGKAPAAPVRALRFTADGPRRLE
jgi:hypothetical protein